MKYIWGLLLSCWLASAATAAEPVDAPVDLDTGGSANCAAAQCIMSRLMATGVRGADISVAVVFDRERLQPRELVIEVPAAADRRAGIKYGFANPDGKIVRYPWGREFSAPITSCEKDTCRISIENDITLEGHNLQKDFLDSIQKYGAFVVSFQSRGQELSAAVSSALLTGDRELMLAENKKTEQGESAGARQVKGWDVQCRDKICTMSHIAVAERGGKQYHVAAALQFDRATGKPNSMVVSVPPDADREPGAEVAFAGPPDEPGYRKLVILSLKIVQCDRTSCIARVFSDASNSDRDIQANIIENAQHYSMIGVGYYVGGEQGASLESTDQFRMGYQTLQAELKKPQ